MTPTPIREQSIKALAHMAQEDAFYSTRCLAIRELARRAEAHAQPCLYAVVKRGGKPWHVLTRTSLADAEALHAEYTKVWADAGFVFDIVPLCAMSPASPEKERCCHEG